MLQQNLMDSFISDMYDQISLYQQPLHGMQKNTGSAQQQIHTHQQY